MMLEQVYLYLRPTKTIEYEYMTLQNLSKILDKYESQLGSINVQQFELLKGLPFYDWKASFENVAQKTSFEAKASPSFEREYNLKYLGRAGNVFHTLDIEAAMCTQQEGREMMDWSSSTMIGRSMGIDVAWGDTSKFAIVITRYRNNKVEVFYAESFEKPLMNEIIDHIMQLKQRHHITKIYVDGANPEIIRELKARIGEYHDYYGRLTEEQIWSLRSSNSWQIIPVNFQK